MGIGEFGYDGLNAEERRLYELFAPLARKAEEAGHLAKRPKLLLRDLEVLGAGADRDWWQVVVSRRSLEAFTDQELEAVLAHELGHLAENNHDAPHLERELAADRFASRLVGHEAVRAALEKSESVDPAGTDYEKKVMEARLGALAMRPQLSPLDRPAPTAVTAEPRLPFAIDP